MQVWCPVHVLRPSPSQHPNRRLVAANEDHAGELGVCQLDLAGGAPTRTETNPGHRGEQGGVGWAADSALTVRCSVASALDGGIVLHVRDEP